MTERWRKVVNVTLSNRRARWYNYEVSNMGRVKGPTGKILKLSPIYSGHLKCSIGLVHVLVAETFIGPRPKDHVVHHIDENPQNNCADNLEWFWKVFHGPRSHG